MEFCLLVETPRPSDHPSFFLGNKHWSLTDPVTISPESDVPRYACISYVWGSGRAPNPIHPSVEMSDHTLPAITAAIRNQDPNNVISMFWIDAFCVPVEPLAKAATLESMGFIYGRASQVVVVLSNESFAAIEHMSHADVSEMSDSKCLDELERNAWIKSVWTYQEVVNSRRLIFTGEGMTGKFVSGETFLNRFGYYLSTWQRVNGYSHFDRHEKYPYLDAFDNVVLDWRLAEYEERSALQVISQMDCRHWEKPSNIFYSMIGAITSKPSQRRSKPSIESLAETFMTLCEEKGDYSFIYSSTKRDERPGYEWRPAPQIFRPLLSWHCEGNAQRGERDSGGVRLKDIAILDRSSSIGELGRTTLWHCLGEYGNLEGEGQTDTALAHKFCSVLRQIGFTGSEEYLVTTHGFFFPQHAVSSALDIVLWVSTSLNWRIATPGIAVVSDSTSGRRRYISGVFGGSVPGGGTEVLVGGEA